MYRSEPIADAPSGFALATNGPRFAAAAADQRAAAVAALAELQNPMLHDTVDTQCIGCHLATFLLPGDCDRCDGGASTACAADHKGCDAAPRRGPTGVGSSDGTM